MEKGWNGLPYRPISQKYQKIFGQKVYKIPVALASSCPNREGIRGMKTCIFCDPWGSAPRAESLHQDLATQITTLKPLLKKKFKANQFLIYFQTYTSTFLPLKRLREALLQALEHEEVVGIVVGTRPDCLSEAALNLWDELSQKTQIFVELGLQSLKNSDLLYMQRGHTFEDSQKAILRLSHFKNLDISVHLIFGWPDESLADIQKSAELINSLPVSGVKLHHLHVLKNTELEKLYSQGLFKVMSFDEYAEKVQVFLEHLSPMTSIHRLAAFSSRFDELIAPEWTKDKMKTHQGIIDFLRQKNSYQSKNFKAPNSEEALHQDQLRLQSLQVF